MRNAPKWIANLPFPPDQKRFVVIRHDMEISTLYGYPGKQIECKRYISTDKLTMSEWTMPPGTYYEPAGQHHFGDEIYYILKGRPIAFNPETGDTYQLNPGDTLYTPQGTRHQIYNFTGETVVAIGVVAPHIWKVNGGQQVQVAPVSSPRFYKGEGE